MSTAAEKQGAAEHRPETPEDVAEWIRDLPRVQGEAVQAALDERYRELDMALDLLWDALIDVGLAEAMDRILPFDGGRALLDAVGKCLPGGPPEL